MRGTYAFQFFSFGDGGLLQCLSGCFNCCHNCGIVLRKSCTVLEILCGCEAVKIESLSSTTFVTPPKLKFRDGGVRLQGCLRREVCC